MHCVLLNVTKNLTDLWLTPKHKNKTYYIKPFQKKVLNKRISSIKLWKRVFRPPKPLHHEFKYKASEYRSMLLFYLPICLRGLLPKKYVDHFQLLSSAIYILLQSTISHDELDEAKNLLSSFVTLFQVLYGPSKMTMNIHLLTHLPECVQNLGPLWSYSMFSFESNNGVLGKFHHGSYDLIDDINLRY